jgi:hypothetical protein
LDLPRHALPLVERPGLARLVQELRAQAGVLPQRRLQPLVGSGQLGDRGLAALALLADEPAGEQHRHGDPEDDAVRRGPVGGAALRDHAEHRRRHHREHAPPGGEQGEAERVADPRERREERAHHHQRGAGRQHARVVDERQDLVRAEHVDQRQPGGGQGDEAERDQGLPGGPPAVDEQAPRRGDHERAVRHRQEDPPLPGVAGIDPGGRPRPPHALTPT